MNGFIYAIECGERIKIGHSKHPERRFSKIASDAPFPCHMLGYWPGSVADELEVQSKFLAIRSHGEWFAATADLLAFVAQNVMPAHAVGKRKAVRPEDSPLAAWRKQSGLCQKDLGKMLGCGPAYISQMENGVCGASLTTALKIAELSNGVVPVESLLGKKKEAAA